ncbi:helix-turn-helix transcriptional regulator [Cupriavidus basilensis]|uniref:helix-turn-helix transcriptional regulator n=1 Tax=Cupriavidus basilensis TaxID=68895 RepID=UPI0023E8A03A|nr:helix-turn-helix domain-containing protein [Cupriavidus basilensis]MDF3885004.1 helix-turn-helix domain-containing protein [Cupriavidus basilensis]
MPRFAYLPKDIGRLIREERRAQGRSQSEMAMALQVRRQTIGELERGTNVGLHLMFAALIYLGKAIARRTAAPRPPKWPKSSRRTTTDVTALRSWPAGAGRWSRQSHDE